MSGRSSGELRRGRDVDDGPSNSSSPNVSILTAASCPRTILPSSCFVHVDHQFHPLQDGDPEDAHPRPTSSPGSTAPERDRRRPSGRGPAVPHLLLQEIRLRRCVVAPDAGAGDLFRPEALFSFRYVCSAATNRAYASSYCFCVTVCVASRSFIRGNPSRRPVGGLRLDDVLLPGPFEGEPVRGFERREIGLRLSELDLVLGVIDHQERVARRGRCDPSPTRTVRTFPATSVASDVDIRPFDGPGGLDDVLVAAGAAGEEAEQRGAEWKRPVYVVFMSAP